MKTFAAMLILVVALLLAAAGSEAGPTREIELDDGSVITGEVISLNGGVYTIRSPSLGTVKIKEEKVRTIRSRTPLAATAPAGGAVVSGSDVQVLKDQIMGKMANDQEILQLVQSLRTDPDFQKAIQDPAIMRAVEEGDIQTLLSHPGFLALLNKASVKDIEKRLK